MKRILCLILTIAVLLPLLAYAARKPLPSADLSPLVEAQCAICSIPFTWRLTIWYIVMSSDQARHGVILVPLLCAFGLLGIILAKTAIEQIKRSSGMLTGIGLALTCYLLPLIGTINLIVSWMPMPGPLVSLAITVVAVGGSILYMIYETRSARRQMAAGA